MGGLHVTNFWYNEDYFNDFIGYLSIFNLSEAGGAFQETCIKFNFSSVERLELKPSTLSRRCSWPMLVISLASNQNWSRIRSPDFPTLKHLYEFFAIFSSVFYLYEDGMKRESLPAGLNLWWISVSFVWRRKLLFCLTQTLALWLIRLVKAGYKSFWILWSLCLYGRY